MGGKSDYLENELLDHVLGGGDYSRPATVYIALYTTAPTDAGGGVEVSGGSYARKSVTNNDTEWPAAAGGLKSNANVIEFVEATGDWGTIVACAIFDAVTSGNMLYWGNLSAPKVISSGSTARFLADELDITED